MAGFTSLLRNNPNYRYTWMGQVVSEVGDHFNTVAVMSLALHLTGSGLAVGGTMLARTIPAILAGPMSGVVLDRFDRRKIMIASDLARSVIALAFVLILMYRQQWLLYALSGALAFASPFFTSGRSAILPRITTAEELHTANALTQTTAWLTLSIGAMLGGLSTNQFGYQWAFVANALSFVFSAWAVWNLKGRFLPDREHMTPHSAAGYWQDFRESIAYMRATPLVLGIALSYVGWASGGGAAQMLFTMYGEVVFKQGPFGLGLIWACAGFGLVGGGILAHRLGNGLGFRQYKRAISVGYFIHGLSYVLFAVMPTIWLSSLFIALSRVGMGSVNVLNRTMLLTHVPDRFRGRIFSTTDMVLNAAMMISLMAASVATDHVPIRTIGVVAGCLSGSTAFFWFWASAAGKLPEPTAVDGDTVGDYESPVTRA